MSGLSFTVGFFKTSIFVSLLVGFFRGQGRTYLAIPYCLSCLKKTKYQKRNFSWLSVLNLKDIPHDSDPRETLDRVHIRCVVLRGAFMSKTVATFVQKSGFKFG